MKETKLYAKLRPQLLSWGECDRVENSLGSGMSDVHYNIAGTLGWIETKVAKGDWVYFEKFQPNWMMKHARLGARIFIIVLDKFETIRVYRAEEALGPKREVYGKWQRVRVKDLPPCLCLDPPYRDWGPVKQMLTC